MGCCCCCGPKTKLRVNVIKAEGLGDYDIFGSVDPYVEVEYDGKKRKTKKIKDNKNPVWNDILEFDGAKIAQGPIVIRLMDWDRLSADDFIGDHTLGADLPSEYNRILDTNFTIKNKEGVETGRVYIKLEFVMEK